MNNKGFAITIIMYSMVFLLISVFYILLGVMRTRYTVNNKLRENLVTKLNEMGQLGNIVTGLCDDTNIDYVKEYYQPSNTTIIDTPQGSGNEKVCYYTSTETNSPTSAEENGNVIFGDYCWQIVRTTTTGGVKLIYNGPKTVDNKCSSDAQSNYSSNPRPESIGVVGDNEELKVSLSGQKIYGDSFEIFNDNGTNKFRLKDTSNNTWSDSTYEDLIGKYVCGTSSAPTGNTSSCQVLYYIGNYISNEEASVEKYTIATSAHYSQIGTSSFNAYSRSLALVGYMFNKTYLNQEKSFYDRSNIIDNRSVSGSYYFGDDAVWVNDHYELKMNGATPASVSSWSSIRQNALGMWTCLSNTSTSCESVHYIVANSNNSTMLSIILSNAETKDKTVTWHYGTSISKTGGTYTLMNGNNTSSLTKTFKLADWPTLYNDAGYKNIYVCDDFVSTSCSTSYFITSTSNYAIGYNILNYTYKFANNVIYDDSTHEYKYDTTKSISEDIYDLDKHLSVLNNNHYFCENYDEVNNSCGANNPVYYVNYSLNPNLYYVSLTDGKKIEDVYYEMLSLDDTVNDQTVNKYNSAIKGVLDSWYESNLLSLSDYLDSDAVFCNDRSIGSFGGWSPTGSVNSSLNFRNSAYLDCPNITDRFSFSNDKAKLKYPIGLLTRVEQRLMNQGYSNTGNNWWLLKPYYFYYDYSIGNIVSNTGSTNESAVRNSYGIRPVIVLKPGVEIDGSGTYNDPYVVKTSTVTEP